MSSKRYVAPTARMMGAIPMKMDLVIDLGTSWMTNPEISLMDTLNCLTFTPKTKHIIRCASSWKSTPGK